MSYLRTAPHECKGHLNFVGNGLSPYWLLSSLLGKHDGYVEDLDVQALGESWTLSLNYKQGGIAPREDLDVDAEAMTEYTLNAEGPGERTVTFFVSPRWPGMQTPDGDEINSPFDNEDWPDEGVNVHFEGSNLEPPEYPQLFRRLVDGLADAVDLRVNPGYFRTRRASTIYEYERYVRIARDRAEKVVGTTGTMQRLYQHAATQEGYCAEYKIDNQEIVGHNHRFVVPQDSIRNVLPDQTTGKQIKHYHPKEVQDDPEDPLFHPKLGVLFRSSLNREAWSFDDHGTLRQEIDELLVNLLSWSGLPVKPDPTTYIPDDHFSVVESEASIPLYDDPTPQLESEQNGLIVRTFAELTDTDLDVLDQLATDGGEPHPEELADGAGYGVSTIYRALRRLDDLVENDNAAVRFRSEKIKQDVTAILDRVEDVVESSAAAVARVAGMDPQQLRDKGAAFQQWLNQYAADLQVDDHRQQRIKIGATLSRFRFAGQSLPAASDVIQELDAALAEAGIRTDFRNAIVEFDTPNGAERLRLNRSHGKYRRILE